MNGGAPDDELMVVIADDEELARHRLLELLRARPGVRIVGECSNGRETLAAVREMDPDVLFLDVQMPGLDGFEVLARLEPEERPMVIFSTAYDEYALAAFDVHAVDYLLKPFDDERWEEAFERAETLIRTRRSHVLRDRLRKLLDEVVGGRHAGVDGEGVPRGRYRERFAVRGSRGVTLVEAASVEWIEADGDYARLHTGAKTHLLRTTMSRLGRQLDPREFVRIHRSTIVRVDRVRELRSDSHGDWVAVLEGGRPLRVGRTYRDDVLRRFGVRGPEDG